MRIEIDQSGQIGKLNTDTIFAFANSVSHAIVVPARVKRVVFEHLKQRYTQLREPYITVFAASIFLLIKDHLKTIDRMLIDEEFTGKEPQIRSELINYIRAIAPTFTGDRIVFWRIGKRSRAHQKAYGVYQARRARRRQRETYRVVTAAELLKVLRIK